MLSCRILLHSYVTFYKRQKCWHKIVQRLCKRPMIDIFAGPSGSWVSSDNHWGFHWEEFLCAGCLTSQEGLGKYRLNMTNTVFICFTKERRNTSRCSWKHKTLEGSERKAGFTVRYYLYIITCDWYILVIRCTNMEIQGRYRSNVQSNNLADN